MNTDFVEWCSQNGWHGVVQADLDRRDAEARGASIFSQPVLFYQKRDYYREVYLKSQHWQDLRALKLSRSAICEFCGKSGNVDVHHLRYKNLYDVQLCDLIVLCRRCHDFEHAKLEVQQQETWTKRITSIAQLFKCSLEHIEEMLTRMGLTRQNLIPLTESGTLKFGIFNTAFSTRPIGLNRMAFLTLCGKREFNQQKPPAETSGCVQSGVDTN